MGSFKVNIMVSIMVSQILTKNSFKSGNGLVISPLLQDFYFKAKKLLGDFDNEVSSFLDPKLDIPFVSDPKYLSFLTGIVYNISS